MSEGLTAAETIVAAWFMAITNRPITSDLIFHSDRGVQYVSEEFTEILKANELIKVEWIYHPSNLNKISIRSFSDILQS